MTNKGIGARVCKEHGEFRQREGSWITTVWEDDTEISPCPTCEEEDQEVWVEGEWNDGRNDWYMCDECDVPIWDANMEDKAFLREREWWEEHLPKVMGERDEYPGQICKECFRALLAQEKIQ